MHGDDGQTCSLPVRFVSVALRPFRLALDAYFDRMTRRRAFHLSDKALTAASSAFRSTTLGSNPSGPHRRI